MKKVKVNSTVRVNAYALIDDAVNIAVSRGWRTAHKHVDNPDHGLIEEAIAQEIMNALCEILIFSDPDEAA